MVNYQNGKIYKIVNNFNDMEYWGSTTNELRIRFQGHKDYTKKPQHSKYPFYIDLNDKFDCFKILLVENYACNSKKELEAKEYELMNRRKDEIGRDKIYNICLNGKPAENLVHTEQSKLKISTSNTGKVRSITTKTNISNALKGKRKSQEHINKMKERVITDETKTKISKAKKGKLIQEQHTKFKRGSIYIRDNKRYIFEWTIDEDGERKSKSKTFPFKKLGGEENALQEAIKYQNTIYPL